MASSKLQVNSSRSCSITEEHPDFISKYKVKQYCTNTNNILILQNVKGIVVCIDVIQSFIEFGYHSAEKKRQKWLRRRRKKVTDMHN